MRIVHLAIGLFCTAAVNAETWECQAGTVWGERQIVVKATSRDKGRGAIEVAGTTHDTTFVVNGFNRVWTWEPVDDAGRFRYVFTVKPSGEAKYQEFRESPVERELLVSSGQYFVCRDSGAGKLVAEPLLSDTILNKDIENMSPEEFQAWMDKSLPSGYIKDPETIEDCATNRDLFRAQQLENIIGMRDFLDTDNVTKLAMSSEDQAQASYQACVALIECAKEKDCIEALIQSYKSN